MHSVALGGFKVLFSVTPSQRKQSLTKVGLKSAVLCKCNIQPAMLTHSVAMGGL